MGFDNTKWRMNQQSMCPCGECSELQPPKPEPTIQDVLKRLDQIEELAGWKKQKIVGPI